MPIDTRKKTRKQKEKNRRKKIKRKTERKTERRSQKDLKDNKVNKDLNESLFDRLRRIRQQKLESLRSSIYGLGTKLTSIFSRKQNHRLPIERKAEA